MFLGSGGTAACNCRCQTNKGKNSENSVLSHGRPFLFSTSVFARRNRFIEENKSMRPDWFAPNN
jgi:hypothetical protein